MNRAVGSGKAFPLFGVFYDFARRSAEFRASVATLITEVNYGIRAAIWGDTINPLKGIILSHSAKLGI